MQFYDTFYGAEQLWATQSYSWASHSLTHSLSQSVWD